MVDKNSVRSVWYDLEGRGENGIGVEKSALDHVQLRWLFLARGGWLGDLLM